MEKLENKVFKKNKDMVSRVIDDETILLPIYKTSDDISCIYSLNKVASQVWDLIDGKRSINKIKKIALTRFATTPKEVDKEMAKLLKELREIKAIK